MDKIKGSMGLLSDMQITVDTEGLDAESKTLLRNREVLAVILQGVAEEYEGHSLKEIMDLIEPVFEEKEVSPGRTNTQIRGENMEFVLLNEKTSIFDLVFRAKDPRRSTGDVQVSLHIDIEMQKRNKMSYPIERRGLYYLARSLSAQLSLVTEQTDYGQLEKCYSIWICRDDIPLRDRYSISFYGFTNTKNMGRSADSKDGTRRADLLEGAASPKAYDLMTLVVIRLGHEVYNGGKEDEGYSLLRFLNAIMYPHKEDFMEVVSEYVDFLDNKELWKEAEQVNGLGQSILEEGIVKGREEGIQALITENLEEQVPRERIIVKLQKYFNLTQEKAEQYYERVTVEMV